MAGARERLGPGMAGTARMASYARMVAAEGVAEPVDIALIGDEDAVADPGPRRRMCELPRLRQWMPPARARLGGEVRIDVEERRTRNVPDEVELAASSRRAELPAAVDELVADGRQG